jgi:ketosteroid isomerase-like protein
MIFHLDYERDGRKLDTRICSVCKMRGGKIIEFRDLYFDPVAADAFWS